MGLAALLKRCGIDRANEIVFYGAQFQAEDVTHGPSADRQKVARRLSKVPFVVSNTQILTLGVNFAKSALVAHSQFARGRRAHSFTVATFQGT